MIQTETEDDIQLGRLLAKKLDGPLAQYAFETFTSERSTFYKDGAETAPRLLQYLSSDYSVEGERVRRMLEVPFPTTSGAAQ